MEKVERAVRSQLVRELSSESAAAGFLVLWDREGHGGVAAIVTVDGREKVEVVEAHRLKGDKIVVLAKDADLAELDKSQSAPSGELLIDQLPADPFLRSLRLICSGEQVFPGRVDPPSDRAAPSGGPTTSPLSPGEREMLSHLLEGHSNNTIARRLGTSEAAVKVRLANLLHKMRVDNRTQAVVWALANLPYADLHVSGPVLDPVTPTRAPCASVRRR